MVVVNFSSYTTMRVASMYLVKLTRKHDKNHETDDKTHAPRMYKPKYYEPQNMS